MGWHQEIAPVLRRIGAAALAVVGFLPSLGRAQSQYDMFASGALALAAYEMSKEQCVYSDKLGQALADIDGFLNRQDADRWQENKRLAPDGMIGPRNMARMQGASDCKVYGLFIGNAVIVYFNAAAFDEVVFAEFNRLQQGEGRSITGEAEAHPPPPPAPGSAADTLARLNGGRGSANTPVVQPPPGSTLKRLPADDPPPASSRSQPPPRRPAEPSPRPERPPPSPLAQVPPSVAPSNRAPPSAASQPIPPAAASSSDCAVAGDCRLARATFACNLDDAARIAGAGPDTGREAGLAAVRAGTCEIVAAGRSLSIEATKARNVVYATEGGRHVGYLPVGVFAPADQASTTACRAPGFCAVRPGPPIWICPRTDGLALPTPEAKRAAGCLQMSENLAAEVAPAERDAVALLNMVGGSPPLPTRYHAARGDLIGLNLTPTPTPASRGWCRPGDWCVIPVGSVFCADRASYERIMSQTGEARRAAILAEPACRLLVPGNVLRPGGVPAPDDPRKLVAVEHPVLKTGVASANAFKVVAGHPPLRYTAQVSDLVVSAAKSPQLAAVALSAQGTSEAAGTFRTGRKERLAFCKDDWSEENASAYRACVDEADETLSARADCHAKKISLNGRRYELRERPADLPADTHTDQTRRWLYRDLASGDWLDGSTVSGEATVGTAFNALCPGTDPEAVSSLAYRDPRAQFPRELQGRWYGDRRACADPRRAAPDYEEHAWIEFDVQIRTGVYEYEWPQRINAVRALGRGAWEIDGSEHIDDVTATDIFQSSTYRLTGDGLMLRQQERVSEWVRCR